MATRNDIVERWKLDAAKDHEALLEVLAKAHQRQLEDAKRAYAQKLHRLDRIQQGKSVPGFCYACMSFFRSFHQWDDYEECPRCGAELSGES